MAPRGSARPAAQPGLRPSQPYPLTRVDLEAMAVAARTGSVAETGRELGISNSGVLRRLRAVTAAPLSEATMTDPDLDPADPILGEPGNALGRRRRLDPRPSADERCRRTSAPTWRGGAPV